MFEIFENKKNYVHIALFHLSLSVLMYYQYNYLNFQWTCSERTFIIIDILIFIYKLD